ncbi:unnamed protein product [Phytomonas sp. Hart1]|nr:unnamed protein product [Phytomonas sp. Hart1]|eukprot:CCW68265.1 unnamed protein product [Phytomonas sp. isolate Hart1]
MDANLIYANLPLRRRVFFLMDVGFLEDCFSSPAAGTAAGLRRVHEVLGQAKAQLEAPYTANGVTRVTEPSDDRVIFTLSTLMDLTLGNQPGPSSGMGIASSTRARHVWAIQLDSLLYALEDSSDARRLSNDTAEVVRKTLCGLIGIFYSKGKEYYSREEATSLQLDENDLTKSTEAFSENDGKPRGGAITRLTWSLASPISEDVYKLLTS